MDPRSNRDKRKPVARASIFVAVLLAWASAPAAADAVVLSTSGTIDISNEPDHHLYGVTNQATDTSGLMNLGYIKISPPDLWNGSTWPLISDTPFDITVGFGQGAPSLELRGLWNDQPGGVDGMGYYGKVTSVTSSAPAMNSLLPAPFADLVTHPGDLTVSTYFPDFGISKLPVYGVFEPSAPEPGSAVCFLAIVGALVTFRRKASGGAPAQPRAY
jgi:hypothetical protein